LVRLLSQKKQRSLLVSSTNDVTGDRLVSKPPSDIYRHNWERIFGNANKKEKDSKGKEEKKLQE